MAHVSKTVFGFILEEPAPKYKTYETERDRVRGELRAKMDSELGAYISNTILDCLSFCTQRSSPRIPAHT